MRGDQTAEGREAIAGLSTVYLPSVGVECLVRLEPFDSDCAQGNEQ